MGYSAQTTNAADRHDDSYSLPGFAYKRTRTFLAGEGPELGTFEAVAVMARAIASPLVFAYYMTAGPISYQIPDEQVFNPNKTLGERIKSIEPHPNRKGLRVVRFDNGATISVRSKESLDDFINSF